MARGGPLRGSLPRLVRLIALAGLGGDDGGAPLAADPAAVDQKTQGLRPPAVAVFGEGSFHRRPARVGPEACGRRQAVRQTQAEGVVKMQFWLVAMGCGLCQVIQAMTNGSAARSGLGAIWVGVMSATVSSRSLALVWVALFRLPLPAADLVRSAGLKVVAGGMMGAFIVAGLAFVTPRLGPTRTFMLYFLVIAAASALIDSFGLLGTEAKPLAARQLAGVALAVAGLALARSYTPARRAGELGPTDIGQASFAAAAPQHERLRRLHNGTGTAARGRSVRANCTPASPVNNNIQAGNSGMAAGALIAEASGDQLSAKPPIWNARDGPPSAKALDCDMPPGRPPARILISNAPCDCMSPKFWVALTCENSLTMSE